LSNELEFELLQKELVLLKLEERDRDLNPHKYFEFYDWQDEFIYQEKHIEKYGKYPNRLYLTCANQIGKTFAIQNLALFLCTNVEFRKKRWGNNLPRVIWYVLPTQDHINDFYNEKWEPDILSRDEAKADGEFAWKEIKKGKDIKGIYFKNTKCTLNFITLSARSSSHQGRSVGAILFDEEPPVDKLAELETRTASFNDPETGLSTAILAFAFTPTSAQDYFKRVFQFQDLRFLNKVPKDLKDKYFLDKHTDTHRTCTPQEEEKELFKAGPTTWKRRVSMFEAVKFKSGKRGKFTNARVREFIKAQPTNRDLMIRAFAQFEKEDDGGKIYKYFDRDKHLRSVERSYIQRFKRGGLLTSGIDYGSGSNHPGGYVVTWVSDDKKTVKIVLKWRGEKGKVTTAGDIIEKYIAATKGWNISFPFYDHSCKDLATIYNRITGKELYKAEKSHEIGVGVVDTLYKHNMLEILGIDDEPYGEWAAVEYENLSNKIAKKDRSDELSDCIRYSLAGVAHMFEFTELMPINLVDQMKKEIKEMKEPEDYGVRSWNNVKEDDKETEWITDELSDWEELF
jgi:hypothetical protein